MNVHIVKEKVWDSHLVRYIRKNMNMTYFCKIEFRHPRPAVQENYNLEGDKWGCIKDNYYYCDLSKDQLMDRDYINKLIQPIVFKEGHNSVNTHYQIIDVIIIRPNE